MSKESPPNKISGNAVELTHKIEKISETEEKVFDLIVPKFNKLRINMDE